MTDRQEEPATDPSDCPICGDWRDSPTADCANCGWCIRPCGDALGLCAYAGPHEGPHKIAGSWKQRLEREARALPAPLDTALPSDEAIRLLRTGEAELLSDAELRGFRDYVDTVLDKREARPLPAPLDVERLAQAMRFVGRRIPGTGFGAYADEVAAEYGRLETEYTRPSNQPSTEPPQGEPE